MRFLFVVHRYPPNYTGGSERNIQRMAEAAVALGHESVVLTDLHSGDHNGVRVTSNRAIVNEKFDLILVHGSCPTQDFIHYNSEQISKISPIYYLLVQPSDSHISQLGMKNATYIGCGTSFDVEHAIKYGHQSKIKNFTYGIDTKNEIGQPGFRERYGINTKEMFLSIGGFWPHKQHIQLANAFREVNRPDCTLVLMGYDVNHGKPPAQSANVKVIVGADDEDVRDALWEADLLVQNSISEGYGLSLVEGMLNRTPWISTPVAFAYDNPSLGELFVDEDGLKTALRNFVVKSDEYLTKNQNIVLEKYDIERTIEHLVKVASNAE